MRLHTWVLFVATEAALSATPGPAVLFVLSQAIRRGARRSVWAALGILSANVAYFALSATSLGAIILASYRLFVLIKYLGAGYLLYLAARCFFARSSILALPELAPSEITGARIWRDAFFVQAANPKALVYFAAILPQFVDPKVSVPFQILLLGITSVVVECSILIVYGRLAARAFAAARNPRFERLINFATGALLLAAGLGLARISRN